MADFTTASTLAPSTPPRHRSAQSSSISTLTPTRARQQQRPEEQEKPDITHTPSKRKSREQDSPSRVATKKARVHEDSIVLPPMPERVRVVELQMHVYSDMPVPLKEMTDIERGEWEAEESTIRARLGPPRFVGKTAWAAMKSGEYDPERDYRDGTPFVAYRMGRWSSH